MITPPTSAPPMLSSPPRITTGKVRSPMAPSCGLMPPMIPTTIPATAAVIAARLQESEKMRRMSMPIPKAAIWSSAVARMATPVRVKRKPSPTSTMAPRAMRKG